MQKKFRIAPVLFEAAVLLGVLLVSGSDLPRVFAQDRYLIPGDARKGWRVFNEKGCIQCHSMGEKGKMIAPDLSKTTSVQLSAAGLAAEMWNHAPGMWEKMTAKWVEFKQLNDTEMADLFAFLYFIRYLDEPGNPVRGKEVLRARKCTECHGVGEKRGKAGPDLAGWAEFTNPILWVQMMWNHALKMKREMEKVKIPWPRLEGNDIVDIIAYIRSLKPSREKVFLAPGDPAEGKRLFSQMACDQCHAIRGKGGKKGPDLGIQKKGPPTIGQVAGSMWNHFPEMFNVMQKENIKSPEFSAKDMANITAYLFSIRYFDPLGNRAVGKKLFQERRCNSCHDVGKEAGGVKEGPNLAKLKGMVSPIYMATALWNHGPKMIGKMKEKKLNWHKIGDKELIDLMEYLNQGD